MFWSFFKIFLLQTCFDFVISQLSIIQPSQISHFGFLRSSQQQQQQQQKQLQHNTFYLNEQQNQKNIRQQARNLLLMKSCQNRPIGCTLNCPSGFAWGLGGNTINDGGLNTASCLCVCQIDACVNKVCGIGEICVSNQQFVPQCILFETLKHEFMNFLNRQKMNSIVHSKNYGTICPRLVGGICTSRCNTDDDCQQNDGIFEDLKIFSKCCNNGCGRECILTAVTLFLDVSSEATKNSINPISSIASLSHNIAQTSFLPIKPIEKEVLVSNLHSIAPKNRFEPIIKLGDCPQHNFIKPKCNIECKNDNECNGVEKCCEHNCGRACMLPEKTSGCIHMLSSIERLPDRVLANGYVPSCSSRGNYNSIQCDKTYCWCVASETGNEIYGTKLLKSEHDFLNCREIRSCSVSIQRCALTGKKCTFGFETDEKGCPLYNCVCRNICDNIKCSSSFYECQLVEPECANPPCFPVPKCLLNPCKNGLPMKMSNDVTALCKHSAQCWDGFWCHQIGYNGLGFCCPNPLSESREGNCQPNLVNTNGYRSNETDCTSECKVDTDCPEPGKCCFNGCGLKCTFNFGGTNADRINFQKKNVLEQQKAKLISENDENQLSLNHIIDKISQFSITSLQQINKKLLINYPKLTKCPSESVLKQLYLANNNEKDVNLSVVFDCQNDDDCPGMQMCCGFSMSKIKTKEMRICVYAQSTTRCLHQSITFDCYKRRLAKGTQLKNLPVRPLRCSERHGEFDEIQCNSQNCFCVNHLTGIEVVNTRITLAEIEQTRRFPICNSLLNNNVLQRPILCPLRHCGNVKCLSNEFIRDENGCATCSCVNPCASVQCEYNEICVLAQVECINDLNIKCKPQPRCIKNVCPNDELPFMSVGIISDTNNETNIEHGSMVVEQCLDTCPIGYWCNNIGLAGLGGICCPLKSYSPPEINTAKNLIKCPQKNILLLSIRNSQNELCALHCRTNEDCNNRFSDSHLCCFNGCGTICISIEGAKINSEKINESTERIGECAIPINRALGINKLKTSSNCGVYHALRQKNFLLFQNIIKDECSNDFDCLGIQKCCLDGCSGARRCEFALKTTPCYHLYAAFQQIMSDETNRIRCTKDGLFEMIQCDNTYCWCVDKQFGNEIEGTHVSASQIPNCNELRKCKGLRCATKRCLHGFEKDVYGCNTCECNNPCKDIQCSDPNSICVPEAVECSGSEEERKQCPYVPKCIQNVCGNSNAILIRNDIFRPEFCRENFDCPQNYFCRILTNDNGVCCFGDEPIQRNGQCPSLTDFSTSYSLINLLFCKLKCIQDEDCKISTEKCCFNGCGLSCLPSVQKSNFLDQSIENQLEKFKKIGICPRVEKFSNENFCQTQFNEMSNCESDEDCTKSQKCCLSGCKNENNRVCMLPEITTPCLQMQSASLLLLKPALNNVFMTKCDENGRFEEIQHHNGFSWCVEPETGHEIYGTKLPTIMLTNCNKIKKKTCTVISCPMDCPYGYETDISGCKLCACKNPCHNVRCAPNHVCRMTRTKCIKSKFTKYNLKDCNIFVPKCILNTCLKGEFFDDKLSEGIFDCDDYQNRTCPVGWYCQKIGIENIGYCCPGLIQQSRLQSSARLCPSVTQIQDINNSILSLSKIGNIAKNLECRISENCPNRDETCCFNGKDTSCLKLKNNPALMTIKMQLSKESNLESINDDVSVLPRNQNEEFGNCPTNIFSSKDCRNDCSIDAECQNKNALFRCCPYGCGRRCQFAYDSKLTPITTCLNYLVAVMREADKILIKENENKDIMLSSSFVDRIAQYVSRNEVQCTLNGLYRRVQCSLKSKECWCVDDNSGIELLGTRTSSLTGIDLNCYRPKNCKNKCEHLNLICDYGLRLDSAGCPLNDVCECKTVCDNFECVNNNEICVPKKVSKNCGNERDCPPIPICVSNPCLNEKFDRNEKITRFCDNNNRCDNNKKCKFVKVENENIGICCLNKMLNSAIAVPNIYLRHDKIGFCPTKLAQSTTTNNILNLKERIFFDQKSCKKVSNQCEMDGECLETEKCCEIIETKIKCSHKICIQPLRATNCINLLVALQNLRSSRVTFTIDFPSCNQQSGAFNKNQCDSEGWCWCVDSITGRPILGTRRFQPTTDICNDDATNNCPIVCSQNHIDSCTFGIETDRNECPKNSNCKCRSLCAKINCSHQQICVMRDKQCQDEICLPVPVCELNPCLNNQSPIFDAKTNNNLICSESEEDKENNLNQCPTDHYCTGLDENQLGVCCPGKKSSILLKKLEQSQKNNRKIEITNKFPILCLNGKSTDLLPNLINYFYPNSNIRDTITPNTFSINENFLTKYRLKSCSLKSISGSSEFVDSCDKTHYCAIEPDRLDEGVCCPSKKYICSQAVDSGYGINDERTNECKYSMSARYYFDNALDSCIKFIYGGCGGNLNNFLYKVDCESFCLERGAVSNFSLENQSDNLLNDNDLFYIIDFLISNASNAWNNDENLKEKFKHVLKDYIQNNYKVELNDLQLENDNFVHFMIKKEDDATGTENNILRKISTGNFKFPFNNDIFHAKSNSLITRQEVNAFAPSSAESEAIWNTKSNEALFWIISMASFLFALIVIVLLCCGYNFLRIHSTDSRSADSLYREVSPTSYSNDIRAFSQNMHQTSLPTTNIHHTNNNNNNNNNNQTFNQSNIENYTKRQLKVISVAHNPRPQVPSSNNDLSTILLPQNSQNAINYTQNLRQQQQQQQQQQKIFTQVSDHNNRVSSTKKNRLVISRPELITPPPPISSFDEQEKQQNIEAIDRRIFTNNNPNYKNLKNIS